MASVSSLDKDLARSRKARYTPEAAAEVTHWIQEVLKGPQAAGELMDVLKDGSVLCECVSPHMCRCLRGSADGSRQSRQQTRSR